MKILASLILIFTFALSYSQDNTWTKDDKLFMYQACRDITDKKYPTPEESETFTSPDVKQYIEIKTKACNCMVDQVQKTMLKATYKSWMENEQINFIESRVSDCIAMYKVALDALNVKSKQEDLNEKKETVAPVKEKQKISNKDFVGIWNCTLPNFLIKQNPKTGEREILKDYLGFSATVRFFEINLREDGTTEVPFLTDAAGNSKPAEGRIRGNWTFDDETKTITFTTFESKKGVINNQGTRHDKTFNIEYYRPGFIKLRSMDDYTKTGPVIYQLTKQK